MKKYITLALLLAGTTLLAQSSDFNALLQANVDAKGHVDYKSLKANESRLDKYLATLNKTAPSNDWSVNKEKAFWMNVYNAYTIKIIFDPGIYNLLR